MNLKNKNAVNVNDNPYHSAFSKRERLYYAYHLKWLKFTSLNEQNVNKVCKAHSSDIETTTHRSLTH